ncbi:MAG: cytochrome c oxidase subunit II [Gemmatimonadota bacterium]
MNEPRQTGHIVSIIALFLGIMAMTVVGFSVDWAPPVASVHGQGVDAVMDYLLLTTGTILVIASLILVAFLWYYGRGKQPASHRISARTERWWTLVPVLGMALIAEAGVLLKGLPVWEQVYGHIPEDALVVDITAKQFEWLARYPGADGEFGSVQPSLVDGQTNPAGLDRSGSGADDIVLRNVMHIPVGRPVHVRLRSLDVLHSFSIPAFRVKQDIVPGTVGRTLFTPTRAGSYELACAELCGMGHYRMDGRIVVHSPEEYEAWLAEQTAKVQ